MVFVIVDMSLWRQACFVQSGFFVPTGEFRGPGLQVGPKQIAQFADFLLGVELGAQIHEVQKSTQAEAHHKVLAVIKGQDASGVLLCEASLE